MAETNLTIADFPAYFEALWKFKPFAWQEELLAKADEDRRWPDLIDLPTGSGKTAVLDLAVFLMALDAQRSASARWMPRRVALVVDRRQVVDQAEQRASHIVSELARAGDGVLATVAAALGELTDDGAPLVSTVLRGGIVRDETWAQRPDVPALISSTVDQVGSRLLFRGYGVSSGMRPIHAGLLGNDTLFVLDEVHLARPFAQTLHAIAGYRGAFKGGNDAMPDRWQVIEMSATPSGLGPDASMDRFPTTPMSPAGSEVLERRLDARKPTTLVEVKVPKDPAKANEQFAKACAKEARSLLAGSARTLGVIVNRVDTARRVARSLNEPPAKGLGPEVILLTGRMRSIDREAVMTEYGDRLKTGHERSPDETPLVVVATQSIEAGADFDLDGIVTECASFDALRQRFGRVDRDGKVTIREGSAQSSILVRSADLTSDEDDPVYGQTLRRTWAWLNDQPQVDFRIGLLEPDDPAPLVATQPDAPLLFPSHLDQWVQTSHRPPMTDPDVSRWLHGLTASQDAAEVSVIWRDDLDESLFSPEAQSIDGLDQQISDRMAACPPASAETLAVPIGAFRRWARGEGGDNHLTDVPGTDATAEEPQRSSPAEPTSVFRWTGGAGEVIGSKSVRPGDTVIVPHSRGGIALRNWDPDADAKVEDVAFEALAKQRRRAVLRLTPDLLRSVLVEQQDLETGEALKPPDGPDVDELEQLPAAERAARIRDVLRWWADGHPDGLLEAGLAHLVSATVQVRAFTHAVKDGEAVRSFVVSSRVTFDGAGAEAENEADLPEDDGRDAPSFTGQTALLGNHLRSVGHWADRMSSALGFAEPVVRDLRLAGQVHDVGKADPRFQRWLHDGDEMAAATAPEPLAKSAVPDTDRQARAHARQRSGYPSGGRHELLSLDMIDADGWPCAQANDPELVRYLVSSHHGFGRYRFNPVEDTGPSASIDVGGITLSGRTDHQLERLDSGIPDRFWRLVRRYGWFDLAWMEAILRLADHKRSSQEQLGRVTDDSQVLRSNDPEENQR